MLRTVFLLYAVLVSSFALPEASLIYGTVTGATGEPVSAVTVRLMMIELVCPQKEVLTDKEGRYQFTDVEVGRYHVIATKEGYERAVYGLTSRNPAGEQIVISASAQKREVNFQLLPGAAVTGHIYDAAGNPVTKSYVFFQSLTDEKHSNYTFTDELGFYWIADLAPDLYKISSRKYLPQKKELVGDEFFYPGTPEESEAQPVFLEAGKTAVMDLYFQENHKSIWDAAVTGPKGEPVSKVDLSFLRISEGEITTTYGCRTDSDGTCSVRELPDGNYWVYVQYAPPPYTLYVNRKKAADPLQVFAKPVEIEKGKRSRLSRQR